MTIDDGKNSRDHSPHPATPPREVWTDNVRNGTIRCFYLDSYSPETLRIISYDGIGDYQLDDMMEAAQAKIEDYCSLRILDVDFDRLKVSRHFGWKWSSRQVDPLIKSLAKHQAERIEKILINFRHLDHEVLDQTYDANSHYLKAFTIPHRINFSRFTSLRVLNLPFIPMAQSLLTLLLHKCTSIRCLNLTGIFYDKDGLDEFMMRLIFRQPLLHPDEEFTYRFRNVEINAVNISCEDIPKNLDICFCPMIH